MKEVTPEEFYQFIGDKDVVLSLDTYSYPYDAYWRTRQSGFLMAKMESYFDPGKVHPVHHRYLIAQV